MNDEITSGADILGALLMGHAYNSWWTGSDLSIEESRRLVPHQNATTMQVAISVVAAAMWMIENPERGRLRARRSAARVRPAASAKPYLGKFISTPSDWTPLKHYANVFRRATTSPQLDRDGSVAVQELPRHRRRLSAWSLETACSAEAGSRRRRHAAVRGRPRRSCASNYAQFKKHLPRVQAYYAVKANSDPAIVQTLYEAGASFDVASHARVPHRPREHQGTCRPSSGRTSSGTRSSTPIRSRPTRRCGSSTRTSRW